MGLVDLVQQFARFQAGSVNIGVKFPAKLGCGLFYLLRKYGTGPYLQFLSGCFELRHACSQLLADTLSGLLQRKLVQAYNGERWIVVVQPDAIS